MPQYNYNCKNCNNEFFILCGIDDDRSNVICTHCQSTNVARIFNSTILKGKRAKGYIDEEAEKKQLSEQNEKHQHLETHQCSPELDYL